MHLQPPPANCWGTILSSAQCKMGEINIPLESTQYNGYHHENVKWQWIPITIVIKNWGGMLPKRKDVEFHL